MKHGYAAGELVAEIGGCFLAYELGLPTGESLTNHVAYLQSWLQAMQNDPKYIFKASASASKAVDYLLRSAASPSRKKSLLDLPQEMGRWWLPPLHLLLTPTRQLSRGTGRAGVPNIITSGLRL